VKEEEQKFQPQEKSCHTVNKIKLDDSDKCLFRVRKEIQLAQTSRCRYRKDTLKKHLFGEYAQENKTSVNAASCCCCKWRNVLGVKRKGDKKSHVCTEDTWAHTNMAKFQVCYELLGKQRHLLMLNENWGSTRMILNTNPKTATRTRTVGFTNNS
jgi:hypothetical protein